MRAFVIMLRDAADPAVCFFGCRNIIEAFRTQKESPADLSPAFCQRDCTAELRMGIIGREAVIAGAALRIEAVSDGDRFEQRGFSAAVLSDKKCDIVPEFQRLYAGDRRNLPPLAFRFDHIPVDLQSADEQIVLHIHFHFPPLPFLMSGTYNIQ